jgi:hypothetical protein
VELSSYLLPGSVKLRVTDYLGRAFPVPFTTGGNTITLQTTGLPKGSYALTVYANGVQYTQKLMIAR